MQITRRNALMGAGAAAVVAGVPGAALASEDPQIEDIQALVSELRNTDGATMMAVWVAFHEVADRLETLPGIVPVASPEWWPAWRAEHHDKPTSLKWPIGPYLTAGRA